MVDTLLHHYQRLWKAEATQEILICCKTSVRARSAGRNYGSLGNLASSPYLPGNSSLVPKKSSKSDLNRRLRTHSSSGGRQAASGGRQAASSRRDPSSSSGEENNESPPLDYLSRTKRRTTTANQANMRGKQPKPQEQVRKVKSMHELRKENQFSQNHQHTAKQKTDPLIMKKSIDDDPAQSQACYSPPQLRLGDKIDKFLIAVGKQQEALAKLLEQRRLGKKSSVISRMSSVAEGSNLLHPGGNRGFASGLRIPGGNHLQKRPHTAPRPGMPKQTRNKPFISQQKNVTNHHPLKQQDTVTSSYDASRVTSKLKQDRNYQPPRKSRQLSNQSGGISQKSRPELRRQETIGKSEIMVNDPDDYRDDFEAEEEAEEEIEGDVDQDAYADQQMIAKKKEAWLYDQAIRGRARQKAGQAILQHQQTSSKKLLHKGCGGYQEKESSKDSAYGFSGGENSRQHTREPTPDTGNSPSYRIINPTPGGGQRQFSRGPPPPVCQNPSLRKQFSSANSFGQPSPNHRPRFSPPPVSRRQEDHIGGGTTGRCRTNVLDNISDDPKKVDFLNQITKDILHKGYFTEKAIKRALESQLIATNNSSELALTSAEKTELVRQLKQQFGLDQSIGSKTRSSRASAVLEKRSSSDTSSLMSNINNNKPSCIIINRKSPVEIKDTTDDLESFEDDLSSILRDESDADIVELLKTTIRQKTNVPCTPKIISSKPDENDLGELEHYEHEDMLPRQKLPVQTKNNSGAAAGKLFESLNLTNLNVSFNSANMHEAKRRLEESRTQALLMKSFAYNGKEEILEDTEKKESDTGEDHEESKAESENEQYDQSEDQTPRSSNLYQSESDQDGDGNDDIAEDSPEEYEEADQGSDNDNCSSRSASVIDDEDIPFESGIQ